MVCGSPRNHHMADEQTKTFAEPLAHELTPQDPLATNIKASGRILNVTNVLPNKISRDAAGEWDVTHVEGNSAMYSSSYFLSQRTDWENHLIGWTGEISTHDHRTRIPDSQKIDTDPLYLDSEAKLDIEEKLRLANGTENVHPVWLLRRDQARWRRYADKVLWPVFHYIQNDPNDGREELDWWHDYVRFNEAYAAKIKQVYKPGDVIWIHDYYLLLLPQILRMELKDAFIGLYVHHPFPSSEYFRILSKRKDLLDGMLGANQIGFQSYSFSRHFISCCARLMHYDTTPDSVSAYSAHVSVTSLPIGIDVARFTHEAFADNVSAKMKQVAQVNAGRKIIIGRDRLNAVQGVVQKLQSFDMFLSMFPEWRGKVVLVQLSSTLKNYDWKVGKKVNELVASINGTYGNLNYSPVQHYQMKVEKDEYLALLRLADLGLITSVRDGMNTMSLEYVVAQKEKHSPLILSEFTGTASVLNDAVLVNPWDTVGVANAINDCLTMEQATKDAAAEKLFNQVSKNTVQNWTFAFIRSLFSTMAANSDKSGTPYTNRPLLLNNYKQAERRLFLFDYDGTLTPIVSEPSAAIPSSRLKSVLSKLSEDPKNQIWIISGRDQAFLEKWFGSKFPRIGLSAEHGCFMKDVGSKEWVNLTESFDMSWQDKVEHIFQKYSDKTPGSVIERKKVARTWHYRQSDPEFGLFQSQHIIQEVEALLDTYDIEIMAGKANVEVRPKFVNKGEIAKRLVLSAHGASQANFKPKDSVAFDKLADFVLCLGDDKTDEDMFKALISIEEDWKKEKNPQNKFGTYGIYPITVGPANKKTVAKSYLSDPHQVMDTLGLFVGQVSLFESGGSIELDDRGHLKNSESSVRSEQAMHAYNMRKSGSRD